MGHIARDCDRCIEGFSEGFQFGAWLREPRGIGVSFGRGLRSEGWGRGGRGTTAGRNYLGSVEVAGDVQLPPTSLRPELSLVAGESVAGSWKRQVGESGKTIVKEQLTVGVLGASESGDKSGPNVYASHLGGLGPSLGLGNQLLCGQAQSDGCDEAGDPAGLAKDDGAFPVSTSQNVAGLYFGLKPSCPGFFGHAEPNLGVDTLARPGSVSFLPGHVRSERGSVGGDSSLSVGAVDERDESSPVGASPSRSGTGDFGTELSDSSGKCLELPSIQSAAISLGMVSGVEGLNVEEGLFSVPVAFSLGRGLG
ncbi:hypothetical protein Salat_0689800 [Sesamum alatum]|uniref:Uncharacterized protein n=1 Tax=Sesamum alatum TaxID=300844 RepID=A0AAE1YRV6_9LAMI|nr:hypothetical protein Salat_0689800 [Sesamum alatum]